MLKSLRRHRLRTRLSLLAITALLWAQWVLALHADCAATGVSYSAAVVSAHHDDCSDRASDVDAVVCQLHCSQADGSPDGPRAPLSVPALPAALGVRLTIGQVDPASPPPPSRTIAAWHRPTSHPASILLI